MLQNNVRRASATVSAVTILFVGHPVLAALYSVKDLGALTGLPASNNSKPNGISGNGKVAASNVTNSVYRAFLYSAGQWTNLGTLGGANSHGNGVNEAGAVVGSSQTSGGFSRAFLWTPGATNGVAGNPQMKDLGTFAGGSNSDAAAINNSGQVTGYAQTATRDRAFRYSGGTLTDIGALLPPNLPYSYGLGINGAGHIVGIAYDPFFTWPHAFFYNGVSASDIGNLGAQGASAVAINDNGQIAGYANTVAFDVHAFRYAGGAMHDLGTLGGHYSYANAINNSNVIVGGSFSDANDTLYRAFIAVNNSMEDLNDSLDATGAGWVLEEALAINDSGQIVGVGKYNGTKHAWLLNPVPVITGVKASGSNILISFNSVKAATYGVVKRENFTGDSWTNLVGGITGTGGSITITNSGAISRPGRFYRAYLEP